MERGPPWGPYSLAAMGDERGRTADPAIDTIAGITTLLASAGQVLAAFLPWTSTAAVALDLSLVTSERPLPPTLGMVLILFAALPGVAALQTRRGWPRTVSATATAALTLAWLAFGHDASLASGVWVAIGATVAHLVAAALAD